MIIYYKEGYAARKGESHALLEEAAADFLSRGGDPAESDNSSLSFRKLPAGGRAAESRNIESSTAESCSIENCVIESRVTEDSYLPVACGEKAACSENAAVCGEREACSEETADCGVNAACSKKATDCGDKAEDCRKKAAALVRELRTSPLGKPYIEGFVPFSISHSSDVWAVLFADSECGLDIQHERKSDILTISRRWFDPADADIIAAADAEDAAEGSREFFRIWARREAFAKALGGSAFDSDLPAAGGSDIIITDEAAEDAAAETSRSAAWHLYDIRLPGLPELYAAICIRI